jgi:hypothetical protein
MDVIPQKDGKPWVAEQSYAEDAAFAAARHAYKALDHPVIHHIGIGR